MSAYLPQHSGLLPYYLLFVGRPLRYPALSESLSNLQFLRDTVLIITQTSVAAFVHSGVCYVSEPSTSLKQFSGPQHPPPTRLLAHTYGVKNIYTGLIRAYAAYNITSRPLYDLATYTYVGVLFLFITELAIWKTVRMREAAFPFVNAGVGLVWLIAQRKWYLR